MEIRKEDNMNVLSRSIEDDGIINIDDIIRIILTNKKFICIFASIGFLLSIILAFAKENLWGGQFQILVRKEKTIIDNSALGLQSANIPIFSSLSGLDNSLSTEVEILKSPSVLMPVFEFVKDNKKNKGINVENMKYNDWIKGNLKVDLIKNTDILDLTYKDVDKEIILPTLEKISETYQRYSGRNRSEGLNKALFYLDEQIQKYKLKSITSLRDAISFAKNNDLNPIQTLPNQNESSYENYESVEVMRIKAASEAKTIKQQLQQLSIEKDDSIIIYIAQSLGIAEKIINQYITVQDEIIRLESIYLSSTPTIRFQKERSKNLAIQIKKDTENALKARLKLAEARMKGSARPEKVLTKYSELIREAVLDDNTLTKLINDRRKISLEKAREEEPWELISNPTVFQDPVEPNRKKFVLIGFILSIFSSISIVTIIRKLQGIIYNENDLEKLFDLKILQIFDEIDSNSYDENIKLLAEGPLLKVNGKKIGIIPVGDIKYQSLKNLIGTLNSHLKEKEAVILNKLSGQTNIDFQLIISSPNNVTKKEILKIKNNLKLIETPTIGLILINHDHVNQFIKLYESLLIK